MLQRLSAFAVVACLFAAPAAGFAQAEPASTPSPAPSAPVSRTATAVTHHTMMLAGKSFAYTATAGHITLRDANDAPSANVFYVAYTADGPNRPVTFLYNGGPGSSSMWLHMGSYGPRRVANLDASNNPPAPYTMTDNQQTLLDKSDLVFVDAVGTGFSALAGRSTGKEFWGIDEDAHAFAQFIKRYVTQNDRWNSPKFLFGESYGTTRSANLVNVLQNDGMAINGVVLMSSVLDFATLDSASGEDISNIAFFPTEAMVALYHHRVTARESSSTFANDARAFARGEYASALMQGDRLPSAQRDAIAAKMHAFIGLDAAFIERANLRIDPSRFEKELLRDRARTVGRLDGRYVGIDVDAAGESPEYDPSDTAVGDLITGAFNHYIRDELHYRSEAEYKGTNYGVVNRGWNFKRGNNFAAPNVADDLRQALTKNPALRVFSANGYYDLATPFFGTEHTLGHLGLDPALQGHITYGFYDSGHMIYMNQGAREASKRDLARFYDTALAR